jgi:hypothetical protein
VKRLHAIRALHLNYRWRGVWRWLKGRQRSTGQRGWVRVLRDPDGVIAEQQALAEGVFS